MGILEQRRQRRLAKMTPTKQSFIEGFESLGNIFGALSSNNGDVDVQMIRTLTKKIVSRSITDLDDEDILKGLRVANALWQDFIRKVEVTEQVIDGEVIDVLESDTPKELNSSSDDQS